MAAFRPAWKTKLGSTLTRCSVTGLRESPLARGVFPSSSVLRGEWGTWRQRARRRLYTAEEHFIDPFFISSDNLVLDLQRRMRCQATIQRWNLAFAFPRLTSAFPNKRPGQNKSWRGPAAARHFSFHWSVKAEPFGPNQTRANLWGRGAQINLPVQITPSSQVVHHAASVSPT